MSRYRFVAAEKAAAGNVAKACTLLSVSRSAYYHWTEQRESARVRSDRKLSDRILAIHEVSRGTYGGPRVMEQLRRDGVRAPRSGLPV
jgi:hypothetical protein